MNAYGSIAEKRHQEKLAFRERELALKEKELDFQKQKLQLEERERKERWELAASRTQSENGN